MVSPRANALGIMSSRAPLKIEIINFYTCIYA